MSWFEELEKEFNPVAEDAKARRRRYFGSCQISQYLALLDRQSYPDSNVPFISRQTVAHVMGMDKYCTVWIEKLKMDIVGKGVKSERVLKERAVVQYFDRWENFADHVLDVLDVQA